MKQNIKQRKLNGPRSVLLGFSDFFVQLILFTILVDLFCGGQSLVAIEEQVRPIVAELEQQRADAAMIARAAAPAENAAEMLALRLTSSDPKVRQNALKSISAFGSY